MSGPGDFEEPGTAPSDDSTPPIDSALSRAIDRLHHQVVTARAAGDDAVAQAYERLLAELERQIPDTRR